MSAAKTFVDNLIRSKKVVVFSKSYCPYCHNAKDALNSQPLVAGALEWVELDNRADCNEIQDYLGSITGARSVPRVFINHEFFGGGDATVAANKNGKLRALLMEAGAI